MRLNPAASLSTTTALAAKTTPSTHSAAQAQKVYTRQSARPTSQGTPDLRTGLTAEYLKEALTTRVGQALAEKLKAYGVNLGETAGLDVSAEATADRIFQGTTALLPIFARQNPDLSQSELIDKFEETIRTAVGKGFDEALDILSGFAEFDDGMRAEAERTRGILDMKFDQYFASLRERPVDNPTGALSPASPTGAMLPQPPTPPAAIDGLDAMV